MRRKRPRSGCWTPAGQEIRTQNRNHRNPKHTPTHLHQIFEYLLAAIGTGLHVDQANRDEQIQSRNDVAGILHQFVQLKDFVILLELFDQIKFEMTKLIGDGHIQFVVRLRAEHRGSQFREHLGSMLQRFHELALVETTFHVERLNFDGGQLLVQELLLLLLRRRLNLLMLRHPGEILRLG